MDAVESSVIPTNEVNKEGNQNETANGTQTEQQEMVNPKASDKPQGTEKKTDKKNPPKADKKAKEEAKKIKLLLRAFEGLESHEAKLEALGRKYVQLASENRCNELRKDEVENRNEKLTKERDRLQSDYNKANLARSKLESLCRELQRHSKLVKDECQLRAHEEEVKRKELSDKFQSTINDITQQMQENFKANQQLKTENAELAARLKGLADQYELREEHVDKVFKHKQLELQLSEAKMAQQGLQHNEEKEKALLEKQTIMKEMLDYKVKCDILVKQEKELKAQVSLYTDKFEEFQQTLSKSNEVFATFKREMDKMTKKIKKLEKETEMWKVRWEKSNRSLLEMVEERTKMQEQVSSVKSKNDKLENLCRALQKERKELRDKLDQNDAKSRPTEDFSPSVDKETGANETSPGEDAEAGKGCEKERHDQATDTVSNKAPEGSEAVMNKEPMSSGTPADEAPESLEAFANKVPGGDRREGAPAEKGDGKSTVTPAPDKEPTTASAAREREEEPAPCRQESADAER